VSLGILLLLMLFTGVSRRRESPLPPPPPPVPRPPVLLPDVVLSPVDPIVVRNPAPAPGFPPPFVPPPASQRPPPLDLSRPPRVVVPPPFVPPPASQRPPPPTARAPRRPPVVEPPDQEEEVPPPAPTRPIVTVQPGEGLSQVAKRLGRPGGIDDVRALRNANIPDGPDARWKSTSTGNLAKDGRPGGLQPGDRLFIPEGWATA
jgi:hypothetical protein